MSETLTERIKYISGIQPDHLMSAFASDLNEIVTRAEARAAQAEQATKDLHDRTRKAEFERDEQREAARLAFNHRKQVEAERDELARRLEQAHEALRYIIETDKRKFMKHTFREMCKRAKAAMVA